MALFEDYLDAMDEILDKAQAIPFSSKKSVVDVDQLRECIDHIRMYTPDEIKNAKSIVQDRKSLMDDALGGIQQRQEQMLHGHKVILHPLGGILGSHQGLIQSVADIDFVCLTGTGHPGELPYLCHGSGGQALHGHVHLLEQLGNQSPVLLQQRCQQMNLLQLLMIIPNRQVLRILNGFLGFLCKVL